MNRLVIKLSRDNNLIDVDIVGDDEINLGLSSSVEKDKRTPPKKDVKNDSSKNKDDK
jgi:hypothetical protein